MRTLNTAKGKRKCREEYDLDDDDFEEELDEGETPEVVVDLDEQKEEEVEEMCASLKSFVNLQRIHPQRRNCI